MEAGLVRLGLTQPAYYNAYTVIFLGKQSRLHRVIVCLKKSLCMCYNMDKLAGQVAEISLESGEILTRKKFF